MARKSKEFQRLFYQESQGIQHSPSSARPKSIRKKELAAYHQFKEKLEQEEDGKKCIFIDKPKGIKKMSEVLQAFVDPYIDEDDSYEERDFLLQIAIMAWNCAVFADEERKEILDDFLAKISNSFDTDGLRTSQSLISFIEELIERKLALFDADKRIIQNYQLIEHEMGFHLSVAYGFI